MVQNTDMAEQTGEVVHTVTGPQGIHIEHARHALAFHEDIRLVEVAVHRDDRTGSEAAMSCSTPSAMARARRACSGSTVEAACA